MAEEPKRFISIRDFFQRFFALFKGPTFLMTFLKVDPRLREKILVKVSLVNACPR